MLRIPFIKSEFKEHSLCSHDERHSSLPRPYETEYIDPVTMPE